MTNVKTSILISLHLPIISVVIFGLNCAARTHYAERLKGW